MSRTTDQWQELLDGISEGEWTETRMEVYAEYECGRSFVAATAQAYRLAPDEPAGRQAQRDAALIASAPEAVAEVIRLRKELEAMRDRYVWEEMKSQEQADSSTPLSTDRYHATRFAHRHKRTHQQLTRILNPEGEPR